MSEIIDYKGGNFWIVVELNDHDASVRYTRGMFDSREEAHQAMARLTAHENAHLVVWSKDQYQAS